MRRRASPSVTLAVLSASGIAYALLGSAVVPALPELKHALHTSESSVGWVLTGYLLSASVGTSILGRLGDMFGKERVLFWTLVAFAAGTLLAAVSQSLALLIVGRVVQGAAGGIFPLSFGIIRDEFPSEKVAGSIGFLSAVLSIGAAAGIVAGALIVEHLSWQWLFWIPLPLIVAATIGVGLFVAESPIRAGGRVNWTAAALMSIGITAVLLAVTETTSWGWGSPRTIALLCAGLAVCALWVAYEARSSNPLIDMKMMRIRGVWTTNLAAFTLGFGMYAMFIIFPLFVQLPKSTGFGFGASPVMAGLYILPFMAGTISMSFCAGWVADRFGSRAALIVGSAVAAAGFAVTTFVHGHPYDILITLAIIGVGMGLAYAALGNLIVVAVPPSQTGAAAGMNTVMRMIGGAIGSQLAATFIAEHMRAGYPTITGFTTSFVLVTAFTIVSMIGSFLIPHGQAQRRAERETEPALALADSQQLDVVGG